VLTHPERERLQPLNELKGVEGAHAHAHVAQQHDPGADDIGDGLQRLHGLGPYRAMIAGIRLVERREALSVCRPVEIAAVDDHAADRGTVSADIFCHRVDHDGGAVIERPAQQGCGGVVHDQRHAERSPHGRHLADRKHGELRVGKRLGVVGAGAIVGQPPEILRGGRIGEAHGDAHGRQCVGKKIPGAAIEIGGAHDVVAGATQVLERHRRGSLAGADGQRRHTTFERRHFLLQRVAGGIHDP
jgi:hypothetical protein